MPEQSPFRPPWPLQGKNIESKIRKLLYATNMLEGVDKLAVALSGGKDSITLLMMLKAILGYGFPNAELHAIHIGGEFSCGAGVHRPYLEKLCQELGVVFHYRESTMKLETLECYPCSRERRSLIFSAAKEAGAKHIAFGHHMDDSAETLMMNLLQKGEFLTLLPSLEMVKYGVTIIRPLLYVSESEIISFAKSQGFARVMCQCPVGQNSMRKKVKVMIQEMSEHFPFAMTNLARAGELYGSRKAEEP